MFVQRLCCETYFRFRMIKFWEFYHVTFLNVTNNFRQITPSRYKPKIVATQISIWIWTPPPPPVYKPSRNIISMKVIAVLKNTNSSSLSWRQAVTDPGRLNEHNMETMWFLCSFTHTKFLFFPQKKKKDLLYTIISFRVQTCLAT